MVASRGYEPNGRKGLVVNLRVELANDAPVIVVNCYAPHPCGGYYIEDARIYGLPCAARPLPPKQKS